MRDQVFYVGQLRLRVRNISLLPLELGQLRVVRARLRETRARCEPAGCPQSVHAGGSCRLSARHQSLPLPASRHLRADERLARAVLRGPALLRHVRMNAQLLTRGEDGDCRPVRRPPQLTHHLQVTDDRCNGGSETETRDPIVRTTATTCPSCECVRDA